MLEQVLSCELAIFALKSCRRDQSMVPVSSPTNSSSHFWDKSLRLVSQNALLTYTLRPGQQNEMI